MGDEAVYRVADLISGVDRNIRTLRVTRVSQDDDLVEMNDGVWVADLMGNWLRTGDGRGRFSAPAQLVPSELYIGRKWTAHFAQDNRRFRNAAVTLEQHVAAFERVRVPAGEFEAFRIDGAGWITSVGERITTRRWVVPGLNFEIKSETLSKTGGNRFGRTDLLELISLRQQRVDDALAAD